MVRGPVCPSIHGFMHKSRTDHKTQKKVSTLFILSDLTLYLLIWKAATPNEVTAHFSSLLLMPP
jgi:hypothetical protein